jgi:hypothetical protein
MKSTVEKQMGVKLENVVIQENVFNKGFKQAIENAVQSENVQEGEPFAIIQNVAIIGRVVNGQVLIEKMLKDVI